MPEPNSGCLLWLGVVHPTGGHGWLRYAGRAQPAHRFSWENSFGPIPAGLKVCHRCDVPSCINPLHLFLGTQADNMRDMTRKGRRARGEDFCHAKLTPTKVSAIKRDGRYHRVIAADFGISRSLVGMIKLGKRWGHL